MAWTRNVACLLAREQPRSFESAECDLQLVLIRPVGTGAWWFRLGLHGGEYRFQEPSCHKQQALKIEGLCFCLWSMFGNEIG